MSSDRDPFEQKLIEWKSSVQVANALYQLYKSERERIDALESQLRDLVPTTPLREKDWSDLRARVESNDKDR